MHSDEQYMARAIQLAQLGVGSVAPNPLVGSVIVHNNRIIGEGYHERYGEAHAEVNAIHSVSDKNLLSESTIYVTLEPCAHFGNTPPCADLIAEHNFKRVVIGAKDPHRKVDGKGIEIIQNAKIETTIGVMEKECIEQNRCFFTSHSKGRPFVMLKWAQTRNGLIDNQGERAWISNRETQTVVHKWRSEYQSILVGRKTAEIDNPSLTVRAVVGINPVRIVLDPNNKLPAELNLFDGKVQTIVLNLERSAKNENIHHELISDFEPKTILAKIHELGITSVMIEGGRFTLNRFLESNLWDEANVLIGQVEFDSGTKAPEPRGELTNRYHHFGDEIRTFRNQ